MARFDRVPSSRRVIQWLPWPGFSKSTLCAVSPSYEAAHFSENVLIPVVIEIGERDTRTAGVFRAHVQNGSYCRAAVNSPVCFNTLSRAFSEAN